MKRDSNFLKLLLVSLAFTTDSVAEDLYVQVRQTVV